MDIDKILRNHMVSLECRKDIYDLLISRTTVVSKTITCDTNMIHSNVNANGIPYRTDALWNSVANHLKEVIKPIEVSGPVFTTYEYRFSYILDDI